MTFWSNLREIVHEFPYLTQSSAMFLLAVSLGLWFRRQAALFTLCAALALANMPLISLHEPAFWRPKLIFNWRGFSPEGALWLVATAVTTWIMAAWWWADRLTWDLRWKPLARRLFVVLAITAATGAACLRIWPAPADIMLANLVAVGTSGVVLSLLAPQGLRFAVFGASGYLVYHTLDTAVFTGLWPSTRAYWNPAAQLSWQLGSVPGYEVVFAMVFGAVWPLTIAYLADLKIVASPDIREGRAT